MVFRLRPMRPAHGLVLATVVNAGSIQLAFAANLDVEVLSDQATMLQLERPAAEIVVGNPSIADVSVQNSKVLVLTGKSFGETNLIVLDAEGKVIINRRIVVREPRGGYVTVYQAAARQTLYCSPNCETPLVIGDAEGPFKTISKEIRTKQSMEAVLNEIAHSNLALAFEVRRPRLQAHDMRLLQLQLGGVLTVDNTLVGLDIGRHTIEEGCLT